MQLRVLGLGVGGEFVGCAAQQGAFLHAEVGQERAARLDETKLEVGHRHGDGGLGDERLDRHGLVDRSAGLRRLLSGVTPGAVLRGLGGAH